MAQRQAPRGPAPVSDLAAAVLDPVLRRKAGISIGLVQSWEEIVGPALARATRPERLQWPRRRHEDDPFEPATLVLACEGVAALHLQHQTGEVIGRVNAFLGFEAVGRIRIVQKPVRPPAAPPRRAPGPLSAEQRERLARGTSGIEDQSLREALQRLGASVIGRRRR